ncbi:hypothetical protein DIE19_33945 [Burkholderia sp. Bp9126]|nr:hypothetical protein DIE19_33945 [Burkholderia sp. Bp9126]
MHGVTAEAAVGLTHPALECGIHVVALHHHDCCATKRAVVCATRVFNQIDIVASYRQTFRIALIGRGLFWALFR